MGTSSGFRSEAMLFRYFGGTPVFAGPRFGIHHNPDRSGLPSGERGAGAERLGLPSAVRGTLACLTFSHCAKAGVADSIPARSQCTIFIRSPLERCTISRCATVAAGHERREAVQLALSPAGVYRRHTLFFAFCFFGPLLSATPS